MDFQIFLPDSGLGQELPGADPDGSQDVPDPEQNNHGEHPALHGPVKNQCKGQQNGQIDKRDCPEAYCT